MANLPGVKSKIRLFALIEVFHLGITLCTPYVGIFMSYHPNHFQMHNSNFCFVITVKHVLHCHRIIILNSERETLLITNCKWEVVNFLMIYYHIIFQDPTASVANSGVHCVPNTDFSALIYTKVWLLVRAQKIALISLNIGQRVAKSKVQTRQSIQGGTQKDTQRINLFQCGRKAGIYQNTRRQFFRSLGMCLMFI